LLDTNALPETKATGFPSASSDTLEEPTSTHPVFVVVETVPLPVSPPPPQPPSSVANSPISPSNLRVPIALPPE
jgi:hypothetical protein